MVDVEIGNVQELVRELLEQDPKYRDCDKTLSAKVWSIQMGGYNILENMTAFAFLCEYVRRDSNLYSQESIGRARRKIQEEHPHLRGKNYRKRQDNTEAVKKSLGY